jgi:hypothetical protein
MPVNYFNSEIDVQIGDYIEFKSWIYFWKGWMPGRVYYVPGISPKRSEMEFGGLTWVSVHHGKDDRERTGVVVDPETQQLWRTVRFVKRSDLMRVTPKGYQFGEDDDQDSDSEMDN